MVLNSPLPQGCKKPIYTETFKNTGSISDKIMCQFKGHFSSSVHTVRFSGIHDHSKPLMKLEHISQNNVIALSLKINSAFLAHSHIHRNAETLEVSLSCKTLAIKSILNTRLT